MVPAEFRIEFWIPWYLQPVVEVHNTLNHGAISSGTNLSLNDHSAIKNSRMKLSYSQQEDKKIFQNGWLPVGERDSIC